jgi:hypothetical protein
LFRDTMRTRLIRDAIMSTAAEQGKADELELLESPRGPLAEESGPDSQVRERLCECARFSSAAPAPHARALVAARR